MKTMILILSCCCGLALLGLGAPVYHEPDLKIPLFDITKVTLSNEEKVTAANNLAAFARSLDFSKEADMALCAKLLGLALRLDSSNKSALVANVQLKKGTLPKASDMMVPSKTLATYFYGEAQKLLQTKDEDNLKLAGYFLEVGHWVDSSNEDLIYELEMFKSQGRTIDWKWAMRNSEAGNNNSSSSSEIKEAGEKTTVVENSDIKKTDEKNVVVKAAKSQAKVNGLVVTTSGEVTVGKIMEIIITNTPQEKPETTTCKIEQKVGKDMQGSLDAALRLVLNREDQFKKGHSLHISFDERYSKKAGPSAGAAFAVSIYSLLKGVNLDIQYAMTGDITVDGKIRAVGGVPHKIRGAFLDKAKYVGIPKPNEQEMVDLAILHPRNTIWEIQIFSLENFDDALALARTDRPENLQKALNIFADIQGQIQKQQSFNIFRDPQVMTKIEEVLQLAPNHLSAQYLLKMAKGSMPQKLTTYAAIDQIFDAAGLFIVYYLPTYKFKEEDRYTGIIFNKSTFKTAQQGLRKIEAHIPKEVENFYYEVINLVDKVEFIQEAYKSVPAQQAIRQYAAGDIGDASKKRPAQELLNQIEKVDGILTKLFQDRELMERFGR